MYIYIYIYIYNVFFGACFLCVILIMDTKENISAGVMINIVHF